MNRKVIFFALVLALLFNSTAVLSQFDYRKGYIVKNNGDTIRGYIEYGNTRSNTYFCYFKTDSLNSAKQYSPNELTNVRIGDYRNYVSKDIKIGDSFQKLFLEFLVEGSLNLYFYTDLHGFHHYYAEKNNVLYELTNEKQIQEIDGKKYNSYSNAYIGILKYLMQESPSAFSNAEKTGFNHKSLIKITADYHQDICDSVECIVYSKNQKKLNDTKWIFKVGAYYNYRFSETEISNSIGYNGPYILYSSLSEDLLLIEYDGELISTNLGKQFGDNKAFINHTSSYPSLYFNFSPNWRTSFQIEFLYTKSQLISDQITIENKYISIPISIKREFLFYKKLSPFINIGLSYNYHFNPKLNELSIDYSYPIQNYNSVSTLTESILLNNYKYKLTKSHRVGFVVGCGLTYDINKKHGLQFEVRKVLNSYFADEQAIDANTSVQASFKEKSTEFKIGYNYTF